MAIFYPAFHIHRQRAGFTLIELSIVLVIIGLIVGGVLAGRTLIQTAEMRAVITQIEQYKTAANTFKGKYNAIPGDMQNATSYWTADSGCASAPFGQNPSRTCNGNGDGAVKGTSLATNYTNVNEVFLFWNHLALAGLIKGAYRPGSVAGGIYASPLNPQPNLPASYGTSGVEAIFSEIDILQSVPGSTAGKHVFIVGSWDVGSGSTWPSALEPTGRAFTANQAKYIDQKMDDGLPYSGAMTATYDPSGDYCGKSLSGVNQYLNSNALQNNYDVSIVYAGCALYINAGF